MAGEFIPMDGKTASEMLQVPGRDDLEVPGGDQETSFIGVDEEYYKEFSKAVEDNTLGNLHWENQEKYEAARTKYMRAHGASNFPSWSPRVEDAQKSTEGATESLEGTTDYRVEMQKELIETVRERFPKVDVARVDFQTGDKGQIQVKHVGRTKWYDIFQRRDPNKINNGLSKEIKDSLGPENLRVQKENMDAKIEHLEKIKALEETIEEREKEHMKQNTLLLDSHRRETEYNAQEIKRIIAERNKAREERDEAKRELQNTLENEDVQKGDSSLRDEVSGALQKALAERSQLQKEISLKEEQLRQRDQAIEDLEQQVEQQRDTIRTASSEAEREAAETELESLQERVSEQQEQRDEIERELGLTRKEKIKRALTRAGVGLAIAGAIASIVSLILNATSGVGAAVKKVGTAVANLGNKMAAAIPGLLGSVLSLILRTGGELLKFLGNNIWILVVALGAVVLKSLTEKASHSSS